MIDAAAGYIKSGKFGDALSYEGEIPAKGTDTEPLEIIESEIVREALRDMGINSLYSHQAESYRRVRGGDNIIVTTPTASGKTLCYNLPILEDMYHNRNVRALYLFPLKALGHDQKRGIDELLSEIPLGGGISSSVVDGDTDKQTRRKILKDPPNIIISNPDLLHYSMLVKRNDWDPFLSRVKYLVVDELHTYRGVFGTHVHNLFQRFLRLYPDVRIITSSATIGGASEFAKQLFGREFVHIDKSGAPAGRKRFMMFNPEIPPAAMANYLLKTNLEAGIKTLCFTKSRKQTETIYSRIISAEPTASRYVSSYRAGFLPEERRDIEKRFSGGELKAVISTSAFELGIDIGGVDSTILVGYPGSMMSLWQRAGRAGRKQKDSLIMLIAGRDALDQYYVKYPHLLFESGYEELTVDRDNHEINSGHLICAAYEEPLKGGEAYLENNRELAEKMVREGKLFVETDGERLFSLGSYPYRNVDLRMAGESYTLNCSGSLIATNSGRRAYTENFPGAVYLHRGSRFIVKKMDKQKREIIVEPFRGNYYTWPNTDKQTTILKDHDTALKGNLAYSFCDLRVTETLTGYSKVSEKTGEKIQDVPLEAEPIEFETKGFYIRIPEQLREEIVQKGMNFMGAIHAFEHAVISMIPTFILSSRDDIGGISYPMHPQTEASAVFVYDGYPGGVGITKRMYPDMLSLVRRTLEQVKGCDCEEGCPSCIYSPKCGSGNYPLDKPGSVFLMERLLDCDIEENCGPAREVSEEVGEKRISDEVLVYDIETKYSADEVGGWNNAHKMGVSVAVVCNMIDNTFTAYTEERVEEMIERLEAARMVFGFNNISFDNKVLSGYRKLDFRGTFIFDMLADIRTKTGKRFSLDKLAGATINAAKSADGLAALRWYKEGRLDLIEEYCRKDVEVTRDLFLFGVNKGFIHAPMKDGSVIRIPVEWGEILESYTPEGSSTE